jgi:hypothetical protein
MPRLARQPQQIQVMQLTSLYQHGQIMTGKFAGMQNRRILERVELNGMIREGIQEKRKQATSIT